MFYRILRKDLKHKRGINTILFLFMILATVFVASSVSNIVTVSGAVDYCMEKGNVGDLYVCVLDAKESGAIRRWLAENERVEAFSDNESCIVTNEDLVSYGGRVNDEGETSYNSMGTRMIQKQWDRHMQVFDQQGRLLSLQKGQIAMQQAELDRNGLSVGDEMTFRFGAEQITFKIAAAVMDPAFGGDFVGITRYIVSEEDFEQIRQMEVLLVHNFNIETPDPAALLKEFGRQGFQVMIQIEQDMFAFSYIMPMITSAILIVVGLCLIVVAFLILRFTILFTLTEEYKQIGIMKAIGIQNLTIQKIYLVKYLVMAAVASVIGCVVSIPVSDLLLGMVNQKMLMQPAAGNLLFNVACSAGVALVVVLMCYLCTNRLRRFSAIEAIRSGQSGERFGRRSVMALHRSRRIRPVVFMAVNDILSNFKRYVVLILTFAIGTVLIILSLNTISSIDSDEMITNFALDVKADFFIGNDFVLGGGEGMTMETLTDRTKTIEKEFAEKNYHIQADMLAFYSIPFYVPEKDDTWQVMSVVPVRSDGSFIKLSAGTQPLRPNEVALSEKMMEKMEVRLGDTIYAKINGQEQQMLITASYTNYMQMGSSAFVSSQTDFGRMQVSGAYMVQCRLTEQTAGGSSEQLLADLRSDFPSYRIYNATQAMNTQLGSTRSQLQFVKWMIVALICAVNVLITALMMRIFLIGEKGETAMLFSLGFSVGAVRAWQTVRIGIVLLIAACAGVLLSLPLNTLAIRPIFGMMGATNMKISVDLWEAYAFYPLLMLAVISLAAYISTGSVRKLNIMEINNAD